MSTLANPVAGLPGASAPAEVFTEKAAQLSALVQDLVSLAPQAAGAKIGEFKEHGQQLVEGGADKARTVFDAVRRHPLETAAVVVGAGLLTWWLLTRK